jgi:hypothetical protein
MLYEADELILTIPMHCINANYDDVVTVSSMFLIQQDMHHYQESFIASQQLLHSTAQARTVQKPTNYYSDAGTPISAQLSDLHGQLRLLRLAPFCQSAFWKSVPQWPRLRCMQWIIVTFCL